MRARRLLLVCVLLAASLAGCGNGGGGAPGPTKAPDAKRIQEIEGKEWTQVETESPLKVLSAKLFFTGLGETAYLIGELENTAAEPVTDVQISFKGYHQEGRLLDTRQGEAPVAVIPAGGKAPFKIAVDMLEVAKYEVIVDSAPAEDVPDKKLEITQSEMGEPKTGYVWITGEVKNGGTEAVPGVELITVLRDGSGAIVEVGVEELADPLDAGQTASFKFMVMHRDATTMEVIAQPAPDE